MVTSYHFGSNKTTSQDIQSRNTAYRPIGICCIDFDFSFLNLYLLDKDLKGKVSSEAGYLNVCPSQHFHSRKKLLCSLSEQANKDNIIDAKEKVRWCNIKNDREEGN